MTIVLLIATRGKYSIRAKQICSKDVQRSENGVNRRTVSFHVSVIHYFNATSGCFVFFFYQLYKIKVKTVEPLKQPHQQVNPQGGTGTVLF